MAKIPTVKIKNPGNPEAFLIINEEDYDEDLHELWGGEEDSGPVFASSAAAEYADEKGLTEADFEGIQPSGKTGFTKSDVEDIAELTEE